ncbi:MAG: prepilin peptidase [Salinibacterium sp.]|nr:prepilin peptidase [Salinibacterium sp.]
MRWTLAGCSALAALAAVWRLGATYTLVPFLGFLALGVALSWIDLTEHRLPNRLVLPGIAASLPVLLIDALLLGDVSAWLRALVGAVVLCGFYLLLALLSPGGMGMGDVKLAALVGLFAGYLGWEVLVAATFGGFLLGGVAALVAVLRGANRRVAIPFGPWMLGGFWLAVALAP